MVEMKCADVFYVACMHKKLIVKKTIQFNKEIKSKSHILVTDCPWPPFSAYNNIIIYVPN